MFNKAVIGLFVFTLLIFSVSALEFKQHEFVDYHLKCLDINNSYCNSDTQVLVNVYDPNGSVVLDNRSATYNPTYFNITFPTTNLGKYSVIALSPTVNGTLSEFTYEVTPFGLNGFIGFFFLIIILSYGLVVLGTWKRDITITLLGTVALYFVGIWILFYGLDVFKNFLTNAFAIVTLGVAGYLSIVMAIEYLQ